MKKPMDEGTGGGIFSGSMTSNQMVRWHRITLLFGVLMLWAGHHSLLSHFWAWDDFHGLVSILQAGPLDYFFNPEFYAGNKAIFTPMGLLAFEINYALFGMRPPFFYMFQLLLLTGVFLSTYFLLRWWLTHWWSLAGAVFSVFSAPVVLVTFQLQCVQYLQGLMYLVISLLLFLRGTRDGKISFILFGSLFYLLAALSKEIYVPAVFVFPFLLGPNLKEKLWYLLPYWITAGVYILWRYAVLGVLVQEQLFLTSKTDLILQPVEFIVVVFGDGVIGWINAFIFTTGIIWYLCQRPRLIGFVVVLLVILVAPLIPIAYRFDGVDRALILQGWVAGVAIAFLAKHILYTGSRLVPFVIPVIIIFGIGTWYSTQRTYKALTATHDRFKTVGRYVLEAKDDRDLFLPGQNYRAREGLQLRQLTGGTTGPGLLYDPHQIEGHKSSSHHMVDYFDETRNKIINVHPDTSLVFLDWQNRTVNNPLNLRMAKEDGRVKWQFGPYRDNGYSVVFLSAPFAFSNVHAQGLYTAPIPEMTFLLRYVAQEGWVTYSDTLWWQSTEGEVLEWSRK